MRSYLDIMIDVKDGKHVDYEELRVALLFCRDMLFLSEREENQLLESDNQLAKSFIKKNLDDRFYTKKKPLEKWWNGKIPQEG